MPPLSAPRLHETARQIQLAVRVGNRENVQFLPQSVPSYSAPDFATGSKDEIGALAASFSRMRTSVVQAMKLLDN